MKLSPTLQEYAKTMRSNPTKAENLLWQTLRNRNFHGYKFRRQQQLGHRIADFVCYEAKLIIELDGIHHADPAKILEDQDRTKELNNMGFQVLRFDNYDVEENWGDVVNAIREKLFELCPEHLAKTLTPDPSPKLGEGSPILPSPNLGEGSGVRE